MTTDTRTALEDDFALLEDQFHDLITSLEGLVELSGPHGKGIDLLLALQKAVGGVYQTSGLHESRQIHGHAIDDLRIELLGSISRVA